MTTRRQSNNQETILRSNWDNSGIDFKAFTVEVTDTASGPNSTVMDLRVDGISVGSLGKDGSLILPTPLPVASGGTGTDNNTDARTNLGLGSISTQDSSNVSITGGSITGITDLAIADGGTGASTAADARTNLGLGSISTQDSSNILITGGSITGITDLAIADGGTGASTAADARDNLVVVHRAGDTMTGDLTVGDGTAGFSVNIDGANSTDRSLTYLTNGSLRWEIVTNSDSESGLNEGSNFNLRRYNDAGSLIGNSINISRSTGDTTFENDIAVGDGFTMQPDATFSLGVKGLKTTSRSLQYFSGTTLRWEVLTNNSPEEDLTSPSIPTKLADPASLPTGNGWSVAFSPDGVHMAVAHFTSPFIAIYERSGNTFTKLANPATLPTGDARSAAFSPDGKHLVVAHAVSPFITIYERVGNTFTKLPNPATLPPDTGRSVSFSPDGKHLVVGHALTPHVTIYERSGNTFTKVADPAILPPNTVNGVAFSPDGNHLVAVHFDSPFLTIYKRSGNTFTKLADPATTPASTGFAVAFSPNNTHMVVGHDVAPRITIYKISGNTFTKLPDPSSIPSGDVRGVAFSSDDVHMVATHLLSPFITVYERAGDTFTKLPDPSSLPTGTGRGATFSPDAGFMPIAHDTIPFITIYDSPVGVNTNGGSDFSIKRYGDGGTVIGEPIKISRETGLMSLQGLTSVESGGFTLSDGGIAPSDANVSFGIDGVNATNRTIEYFTGDDIRWKIEVNNSPEEDLTAPAVATKLANPAVLPTGTGFGVAVSPDGTHMAVAHVTSPFVTIYERSGNTFTKLANPATLPTGSGFGVAFSPDGTHLAVAHDNFPFIIIYERSGNTFTKLANPATLPTSTGRGVAFSPDGVHLAVTHSSPSPFVTIYERSGNTFTKLANPATLPPDATRGVAFSPDGRHLAVGHFQTPFITIYERSGNTFTKVADPATLPASTGFGIDFSPDGTYMAVAHDSSPFVTIYERSGNTFTKLADPATLPTFHGRGITFSPDGIRLAVAHLTSPFITIYERSGNTFTKLADPATLPTGDGLSVTFSQDATIMPVTHSSTPFVTIYDSPVGVNTNGGSDFSIKRYGDNGAIIGEPLKISRETGDTVFKDGNVGIGATTPTGKLEVSGDVGDSNSAGFLRFASSLSNASFKAGLSTGYAWMQSLAGTPLRINELGNDVLFSGPGRIGIGTASPENKVHVRVTEGVIKTVMIDQAGTGDASLSFRLTGAEEFILGIDNSDGDKFKISDSGALGTNDRLTIDSLGNFGILTSTPQDRLHISAGSVRIENGQFYKAVRNTGSVAVNVLGFDSGTDNLFIRTGGASAGNRFGIINTNLDEMVTVLNDGKVGIGTTTPASKLEVRGDNPELAIADSDVTIRNARIRLDTAGGNWFITNGFSLGTNSDFHIARTADGSDTKLTINRTTGHLGIGIISPVSKIHSFESTAATSESAGVTIEQAGTGDSIIQFLLTGARRWVLGADNSDLDKFKIASDVDLDNDAHFVIDTSGKVGIGTNTPLSKFHINDTAPRLYLEGTIASVENDEISRTAGVWNGTVVADVRFLAGTSADRGKIQLRTYSAEGVTNDGLVVDQFGNVGIGTTTPSDKLEVVGHIRANGFRTAALTTGADPVYIRGTGFNNPANRLVRIGGTTHVNTMGRGLQLTIITASTHALVSNTLYDTHGDSVASDNLATALNDLQRTQVGILTSYDSWSVAITDNLRTAARRLGLFKLGASSTVMQRYPYAAIFYGSGTVTGNTEPGRQAIEIMESSAIGAPQAIITTWFTEDGFGAPGLPNALISADAAIVEPSLIVNSLGNVGIGTTTPAQPLDVAGVINTNEIRFLNSGTSAIQQGVNAFQVRVTGSFQVTDVLGIGQSAVGARRITTPENFVLTSSAGDVGIGIATPGNKLSVNGITAAFSGVRFGSDGSGEGILRDASNGLAFTTGSFNVSFAKMTLTNAGNLGIGSTAPSQKLTVIGNFITGGDVETDATTKHIRYSGLHFTNSEEPVIGLSVLSDSANNIVNIGGGSSLGNAASVVRFYTAPNQTTLTGTERMRITSAGGVGIGITTPRGVLDVAGASPKIVLTDTAGVDFGILATSDSLRFGTFSPTNTESSVVIQNGGNVGIGTTSPRVKLEIAGPDAPTTGAILLRSATNLDAVGMSYTLNANNDVDLHLGRFYDGPHVAFQNDLTIDSLGNVGIGTTGPLAKLDVAGQIRADNVTGYGFRAPGDTDGGMRSPGDGIVTFVTNSVERVRIDANGNVGIGTGVPLGRLRVVGTAGPDRSVLIDNREIKFIGTGAAHFSIFGADTGRNRISISNSSTGPAPGIEDAELLVVTFQGNVGIGATAPASKLEVVGTITSTGLNVNNNLITNVATPVSATDAANKDYVDSTTANLANWELVTTNIAAENGDRLLVDTSSSSITVTMPASPVLGDEVRFADKAGTFASNNLTIARNGSPIQGLLEDLVVDVNNVDFALVFTNATDGWRLSDVSNIVTGADPATTTVFQFTATAGQTVFTGLDDNGFGLVYTPGFEVVFLNGVKLEFADYVRTDSNTITLVEAATVDDVLTVLAFGTFDIANVYTQAEADAAFVAQGELPSPAVADTYLRRNTANTAYEAESSLDVSNDLITSRDWRGKNAIINGNFDIWQRGTSFPITTGVTILTADRWSSTAQQGGTGAATVTRQDFPPGFTDVPGNPRFYLRHDQTIATSASTGYVVQKIESVRTFAGQTVTFSFWARDLSGPTTLAPFIIQNFGTGGSPSTSVFLEFSPFVVTTSFQRFEITINVPSISGKTVGTADNDHIQFGILQNSTTGFTTFTLDFAQAQVELGSVATEFERRPIGTELALCQRYFEKTYDLNTPPGTGANNGALNRRAYTTTAMIHDLVWRFNTRKRVVPTVIPFSNSTGAANIIRIGSNELAATSNFVGHTGTTFQITGNHAAAANDFVVCHGTADAEL